MTNYIPNKVSILGSGWLGKALAHYLREHEKETLSSARTREGVRALEEEGLDAVKLELTATNTIEDPLFFHSDYLVVCIPPGRGDDVETRHPAEIANLAKALRGKNCKRVIFISSTSVYASLGQIAEETDETEPEKASGRALRKAEHILLGLEDVDVTVLRLAGLIGPDRMPGRFLAGKKNIKGATAPVNLVHRDDVLAAILLLLENPHPGEIFNLCAPAHPLRREYYTRAAKGLGLPPPEFNEGDDAPWKIISSEKIIDTLGFHFVYPDPSQLL